MADKETSVKVAVRIRPLNNSEAAEDSQICVDVIPGEPRIVAGSDMYFTFDYAFGVQSEQEDIYRECVVDLVNATFDGFNATILAYGQTGSGKTWTMGSSSEMGTTVHTQGIIPRVIQHVFHQIEENELKNPNISYKIVVQFLEIYGEDFRDLLDQTRSSKVSIREAPNGDVYVAGAREEVVSSVQQMSKTLEDGTKNRTTASTRMNLSSSRSHAIFTVNIEQTIHVGDILKQEGIEIPPEVTDASKTSLAPSAVMKQEVRKCKFHFVDLAGSERLKRTGAQGQQMKEGIDINKGLLALGNVISALGDETKRGKVHVPYRDSKLTRMLQDSLGGNSKTLMICCVSPAFSNFFESVNALRYANRARNIKNKPVVNRDPTLVIIDELKVINQLLASEIIAATKEVSYSIKDSRLSESYLQSIVGSGEHAPLPSSSSLIKRSQSTKNEQPSPTRPTFASGPRNKQLEAELKGKLSNAEEEIRRLTQVLRQSHLQIQDISDRLAFTQGERDFFRMKWVDANPDTMSIVSDAHEASTNVSRRNSLGTNGGDSPHLAVSPSYIKRELKKERDKTVDMISKYVKEIEDLKRDLSRKTLSVSAPDHKKPSSILSPLINGGVKPSASTEIQTKSVDIEGIEDIDIAGVDSDWTATIARAIAQAKEFIKHETKKLRKHAATSDAVTSGEESPLDEDSDDDEADEAEQGEIQFRRRQEDLKQEVSDISESILVKENLVKQLEKSQHQYEAMKGFYEQKLTILSAEVAKKQSERENLVKELQNLETKKNITIQAKAEKENQLKDELRIRDEELKVLKKKQDELNRLSKMQSKYIDQLSKLESDIESMKRQRVELTRTLNLEKKNHLSNLKEKAKEIDYLKRQLHRQSEELTRVGAEKDKAVSRANQAMNEKIENRRRGSEISKNTPRQGTPVPLAAVSDKRNVIKSAPLLVRRVLSQSELKTKKWLEKQILDINAREEAAENLRRQCEQQLVLIKQKESLEEQREAIMAKSISAMVNGGKSNESIKSLQAKNRDDEESLRELDDQIASVDSQLKLRTRQISDIKELLSSEGNKGVGTGDNAAGNTLESLKKTTAQSLPAAHELIRLIFDMLVESRRAALLSQNTIDEIKTHEQKLKDDLSKIEKELQSAKHNHQIELLRVSMEYEEKLQGLFDHAGVAQLVLSESQADVKSVAKKGFWGDKVKSASQTPATPKDDANNEENIRTLLAVSIQRVDGLREQLAKERVRSDDLEANVTTLEGYRDQLAHMIDDRDANIKFLEEERNFFKDMVYDLRAHVEKLGGKTGRSIIRQIRSRAKTKKEYSQGGNEVVLGLSDDEDDGVLVPLAGEDANDFDLEDSKSIMDQFEEIDYEIQKSRSVNMKSGNVVARLTDPSNFTGVHKKVFEEDISSKRKKVQEMKSHINTPVPFSPAGGVVSQSNRTPKEPLKRVNSSTDGSGIDSPPGNGFRTDSLTGIKKSGRPSSSSSRRISGNHQEGDSDAKEHSGMSSAYETSSVISQDDVTIEEQLSS